MSQDQTASARGHVPGIQVWPRRRLLQLLTLCPTILQNEHAARTITTFVTGRAGRFMAPPECGPLAPA